MTDIKKLMEQVQYAPVAAGRLRAAPRTPLLCVYTTAASQTFTSGTPAVVNYETRVTDTHLCVVTGATWKFTAPFTLYAIGAAQIMFQATTGWAVGEGCTVIAAKNGSAFKRLWRWDNANSPASPAIQVTPLGGPFMTLLEAGQTIDIRATQARGGDLSLDASALVNRFELFGYPV